MELLPHPAVRHLHDVREVDDVTLGGRRAVEVPGEVDDDLAALGRPQLEGVTRQGERQQAAVRGDLGELHALLGVRDAVLPLELVAVVAERDGGLRALRRAHQLELVDAGDRGVEEAEAVLAPLDLQHRVGGAVDGEDVADEAVAREVLVERLAPPLRVGGRVLRQRELVGGVVDVLVHRDAVVEPAVVEGERDVVLDVERAVPVVGAHAREPQALALVAHVHAALVAHRLRVVDRVEADHALVDVGAGVVHPVVVEPEEASASRGRRRRPASSGRAGRPTDRSGSRSAAARSASSSAGCRRSPARCARCAGGSGTSSRASRSPGGRG